MEANDLFHFAHAAAALGYCRALFAEQGLTKSTGHRRLALDKRQDCFVTNRFDEATEYLRAIARRD